MTAPDPARIIVLGNEKGGTGKSTTAVHLAVALLRDGHRVGTLDLDARQGTFTRFWENRRAFGTRKDLTLPLSMHRAVHRSALTDGAAAVQEEAERLQTALDALRAATDFVIIDTPGSDNNLSRMGHARADMLVTPVNDSFIDLDLLGDIDPETLRVRRPSTYAEMVWEQRKQRAIRDGGSIDWVVIRNRLSALDARNKREVADVLVALSRRFGFRSTPGFGERVIFRELFLKGLTLLDLREAEIEGGLTMSHIAARQEVRTLVEAVGLTRVGTQDRLKAG
ncbi:MAG: division plane positioning ATPase MipZ [Inquilinaceae bacterium]